MKAQVTNPLHGVYLFEFDETEDMAKAFCRIQEFYESPVFRGKYFTLDEFKKYHVQFFGAWDYYTRWGGFNIPGNVVKQFAETFKGDMTDDEKDILSWVNNLYGDNFYIIASETGDRETINHELHHAMFYLDEYYRNKCSEIILANFPGKIGDWLIDNNYAREVLVDEAAAYLMFEQLTLTKNHDFTDADFAPYLDTQLTLRLHFFKTKAKREYYMFKQLNEQEGALAE